MAEIRQFKIIVKGPKEHELKDAHARSAPISFWTVDEDGENLSEVSLNMLQLTWNTMLVDGQTMTVYQIIATNEEGEDVTGEYRPKATSLEHGFGAMVNIMRIEEPRSLSRHHIYQ